MRASPPLTVAALVLALAPMATAGGPHKSRQAVPTGRVVVRTVAPRPAPPPGTLVEGLGTFYNTPTLTIRGNGPVGGGYSPFGAYGDRTLDEIGPLSSFRATTAPVRIYERGYNGALVPATGTSFSYPYQPRLSPVVYPSRANYFYGFKRSGTPPWWDTGAGWVDLN